MNKDAINIHVQVFSRTNIFTLFEKIPWNAMAGLCDKSMFSFLTSILCLKNWREDLMYFITQMVIIY